MARSPDTVEAVLDSIPPERREEARQVLESLLTGGELVRLSPELCWHREVFQKGLDILRTLCADHGAVTLAEVPGRFRHHPEIRFAVFRSLRPTADHGSRGRLPPPEAQIS